MISYLQAEQMEREVRDACRRHGDPVVWVMAMGDDEETVASLGLDGRMPLDLVIEIGEIVKRHRDAGQAQGEVKNSVETIST